MGNPYDYTTISVKKEVKRRLKSLGPDDDWDTILRNVMREHGL
jgi:hypothetical protein